MNLPEFSIRTRLRKLEEATGPKLSEEDHHRQLRAVFDQLRRDPVARKLACQLADRADLLADAAGGKWPTNTELQADRASRELMERLERRTNGPAAEGVSDELA